MIQIMLSLAFKFVMGLVAAVSLLWLIGYAHAVWPLAADSLRDHDFAFLTYPDIKLYRTSDPATGAMSPVHIYFFSIADGPTGEEYTQAYFPCWIVSLGALAGFLAGGFMLFLPNEKTRT